MSFENTQTEKPGVHAATLTSARQNIKDLVDASESGQPASLTRDDKTAALVDGERLRSTLSKLIPERVEAVNEEDCWSLFIPGLPISAEAEDLDDAVDEMVYALYEYSVAWVDRLRFAPNHSENWGFVQMVTLSTPEQLREWIVEGA